MTILGGELAYNLLQLFPGKEVEKLERNSGTANRKTLDALFGKQFWSSVAGKTVIDFGCGIGGDAVEVAKHGAAKVIGVDIQERFLQVARKKARQAGVDERCQFATRPSEPADLIIAVDSFEHFDDPAAILGTMSRMLTPGGEALISFGPTWFHPYGGHLFSVFPWSHLLFTEDALIRWRSTFKSDGAQRFHEVDGGLNQMTIRRFCELVEASPFRFLDFEAVPIRKLKWLANPLTREFTTAIVRCRLALKASSEHA